MKRPGREDRPPDGGHAEDRRREFEESRGLKRRRELDLDDEEPTGDEEPPPRDEEAES
jgi:hypothetical protein